MSGKYVSIRILKIIFLLSNFCCLNFASLDSKCQQNQPLVISYWSQEPYIYDTHGPSQATNSKVNGIFPTILQEAVKRCCSPATKLEFKKIKSGVAGLLELVDGGNFDIVTPLGGSPDANSVRNFPFIGLAESSGVGVLMKGNASGGRLLLSVLQAWPILVFIVISATIAGVVIWFLERNENPEQFPAAFGTGIFEGFWWAFVTMTTVGYGDKAPKTFLGKLLGSMWLLAGLIMITMFISIITSALAKATAAEGRADIRGVKVSAVNQSEEHKLAIRQDAKVTALTDRELVFDYVMDRRVEAALVDVHGLKHHISSLTKKYVLVATVIPNHVNYGVLLARNSSILQGCLREFMDIKENWRYQLLLAESGSRKVQITPLQDYFGSGGIFSISVYAGLGLFTVLFAIGMGWEYYKDKKKKKDQTQADARSEAAVKSERGKAEEPQATHIAHSPIYSRQAKKKEQSYKAGMVINLPQAPPPRLSFGDTPQEKLLTRQSMEVMKMEKEFNKFKADWEKRYRELQRIQDNESMGVSNGGYKKADGSSVIESMVY